MKQRKVIFILMLLLSFQHAASQKIGWHAAFGGGFNPGGGASLKAVYGAQYKFISLGLSGSFSNSLPLKSFMAELRKQNSIDSSIRGSGDYSGKITNSIMLNVEVEPLKIFLPEIKHHIFIGAGFGATHYNKMTQVVNAVEQTYMLRYEQSFGPDFTLSAGYHYSLTKKFSAGVYFEYQDMPEFGIIGAGIRRFF